MEWNGLSRRLTLSLVFLALATLSVIPPSHSHANSSYTAGARKVGSLYEEIADTNIDELIHRLSDTGTEIVFRGYFKYWIVPPYRFELVRESIATVKARLRWVEFIGGISASAFVPGDHWPNGTYVSPDEKRQMLWMLPNGTFAHHIEDTQLYVLDISKPMARQFILAYSYNLLDLGFDSIWFDEPDYVPHESDVYGIPLQTPYSDYVAAWHEIVTAVKVYGLTKYGEQVPVSMNGDWMKTIGSGRVKPVWPYQDYLTVSVNIDTINSGEMRDDWTAYKAEVTRVYGYLPQIFYFMDDGPLVALAFKSTSAQIKLIRLFDKTAAQEQVSPIYPLHLGFTYDAEWEGTYDTIRQLANNISTVHTVTTTYSVPFISTTTTTTTATTTESKTPTLLENPFELALVVVVGVLGLAVIVLIFRKRDRKPSGHS